MKRLLTLLLIATMTTFAVGCGGTKVQRTDVAVDPETDENVDLSGKWNDTDSRLTAEEIVSEALSRPWIEDFRQKHGTKPRVIVGSVRNKTNQHIPTGALVRDFERELINSNRVVFVASGSEREELRDEREEQQFYASEETRKDMRNEYGADFMLHGVVETIIDREGKRQVVLYQVDMTLTDLESTERVWMGGHKIRKFIKNPSARL